MGRRGESEEADHRCGCLLDGPCRSRRGHEARYGWERGEVDRPHRRLLLALAQACGTLRRHRDEVEENLYLDLRGWEARVRDLGSNGRSSRGANAKGRRESELTSTHHELPPSSRPHGFLGLSNVRRDPRYPQRIQCPFDQERQPRQLGRTENHGSPSFLYSHLVPSVLPRLSFIETFLQFRKEVDDYFEQYPAQCFAF